MEKNYEFLKRFQVIHKPNRRDGSLMPKSTETAIDESWCLTIPKNAPKLVERAATDFQDYLRVSMGVSLVLREGNAPADKCIYYAVGKLPENSFKLAVTSKRITVTGCDARQVFRGSIHLEDLMNLRRAPYLKQGSSTRTALTRMRSIHSGSGMDDFPDWQLNAIAHAGFTAIDLFVCGVDVTTKGFCNINDIIERAESFGLDVVFYNYVTSFKHPDDADAEEFFDSVYGTLMRPYPKVKAIHLVGESLEFPSKDPHTTGKRWRESIHYGIRDTRPSPGWYPCSDYPQYIQSICNAIHKVNPNVEVIFNTYNWGWQSLEMRKKFLETMPREVTLHITYDIFKQNIIDGLHCPTMDYSISAAEPGYYFTSEAETAAALGIKNIRVTSNLAGLTWDFGAVPYIPVPQRWITRMLTLKKYLQECGVNSFYDNHHYGWWPNPCNDLAKEIFSSDGRTDLHAFLLELAERDYGEKAADDIYATWQYWSTAMDFYVGTNEDQYGPWRVGPAYPFIFQPNITRTMGSRDLEFPTSPYARHKGSSIVKCLYQPYENINQTPGPIRYPKEIKRLSKMLKLWETGLETLKKALPKADNQENAGLLYAMGKYMRNSIVTTIHIKQWWLLNMKLQTQDNSKDMLTILSQIEKLAKKEAENVKDTFDAVQADSRLGWEPSMEYVCDEWHLNWKLKQLESTLREIEQYKGMLKL